MIATFAPFASHSFAIAAGEGPPFLVHLTPIISVLKRSEATPDQSLARSAMGI
jgi:hypothetical protein